MKNLGSCVLACAFLAFVCGLQEHVVATENATVIDLTTAGVDVVANDVKGSSRQWDWLLSANNAGVLSLAMSMDDGMLASGSTDGCVTLWDVKASPIVAKARLQAHEERVIGMCFTDDSNALVTAANDPELTVKLHIMQDSTYISREIDSGDEVPCSVAYSSERNAVLVSREREVAMWTIGMSRVKEEFSQEVHMEAGPGLGIPPKVFVAAPSRGHEYVTGSPGGMLQFWQINDNRPHLNFQIDGEGPAPRVAVTSDGVHWVAGGRCDDVSVWKRTSSGFELQARLEKNHAAHVEHLMFAQSGEVIICFDERRIMTVWKWRERRIIGQDEFRQRPSAIAMSHSGKMVAVGLENGHILIGAIMSGCAE